MYEEDIFTVRPGDKFVREDGSEIVVKKKGKFISEKLSDELFQAKMDAK